MNDNIGLITAKYNGFSKSEAAAADYALNNIDDVINMTVQDFSRNSGVSVATVIRFCKKLGFDGYREFCLQLARGGAQQTDFVMDIEKDPSTTEEKIRRVLMANSETIRFTIEGLDYARLNKAAEYISACRSMCLVGMGTSHIVCEDAMQRFMRIGVQSVCYDDPHASIVAVSHYTPEDVVVAISHSGTTIEVYEVQRIARECGARVIGITTYPNERVGQISDVVLQTCTRESPLHKVAITSRTSQLAMIDALFVAVMDKNSSKSMSSLLRVSENITHMEGFTPHGRSRDDA